MIPDTLRFLIEHHNDEDGIYYVVSSEEIALTTEGNTIEDALRNLREAIALYNDDSPTESSDTPQMSHVFISYCHEDKNELAELLKRLHDSGFSDQEIWYDDSIEAGEQWIPQIDTALAESFAVIVLITQNSMKSFYVTYEWSWALGSSMPLFPLLVDGKYDDVHKRLLQHHIVDCRHGIPDYVIEAIKARKTNPPDTQYLNYLVSKEMLPLRVLARVSLWLFPYLNSNLIDETLLRRLYPVLPIPVIPDKVKDSRLKLTEMLVSHSHAFTTKQKSLCRNLIHRLIEFWKMFGEKTNENPELYRYKELTETEIAHIDQFRVEELEPLFSSCQSQSVEEMVYQVLDTYLQDISNKGFNSSEPLAYSAIRETLEQETSTALYEAIEIIRKRKR